jgi:hypothetical protein
MLVRNILLGMGNSFGRIGDWRYDKRRLPIALGRRRAAFP